jgi:hypothetical protein
MPWLLNDGGLLTPARAENRTPAEEQSPLGATPQAGPWCAEVKVKSKLKPAVCGSLARLQATRQGPGYVPSFPSYKYSRALFK